MRMLGAVLLWPLLLCAGCGKKGIDAELRAFRDAGREVSEFVETDPGAMQAKKCRQGTIDQMAVLLCEYGSRESATAGLRNAPAWANESPTWFPLQRDKLVLVVADRNETDPQGKKLSVLSRVFRRMTKR